MKFEPGDIAVCYGTDWISRGISLVTASVCVPFELILGPSHMAIMCTFQSKTLWVESTTLTDTPCQLHQKQISGAQAHLPEDRIDDYIHTGGQVDIYRLTPINRLSLEESETLSNILIQKIVTEKILYDYSGAILSGTRMFQWSRLFPYADLNSLFCSELVAAVIMRLNRMNHFNPSRFNPGRLLRILVRTGKYQRIASIQKHATRYTSYYVENAEVQACE